MHKYRSTNYISYSTGDTHYVVYATSSSPYGPYTYRGRILSPVEVHRSHRSSPLIPPSRTASNCVPP